MRYPDQIDVSELVAVTKSTFASTGTIDNPDNLKDDQVTTKRKGGAARGCIFLLLFALPCVHRQLPFTSPLLLLLLPPPPLTTFALTHLIPPHPISPTLPPTSDSQVWVMSAQQDTVVETGVVQSALTYYEAFVTDSNTQVDD